MNFSAISTVAFSILLALSIHGAWGISRSKGFPPKGLFLGVLTQHYHSLFGSGSVYAVGRRRLVIEDLGYNDGEGGGGGGDGGDGDVFFYCGINGRPSPLGLRFGPELTGIGYRRRLVLKLPRGCRSDRLKWLSVWSRSEQVSLADLVLRGPEGLEEDLHIAELFGGGGGDNKKRKRRLGGGRNVAGLTGQVVGLIRGNV